MGILDIFLLFTKVFEFSLIPHHTNNMKFLLFTVALIHCAFGAADDGHEELGGLDEDDGDMITLVCNKDDPRAAKFNLPKKAAMMSNLVKNNIEGAKTERICSNPDCKAIYNSLELDECSKCRGKLEDQVELKKVSEPILDLIVTYLKHHDGKIPDTIAKPIRSTEMKKIVGDPWDAQFINGKFEDPAEKSKCPKDKKEIFQVILAANYMDIKSLLHLGCAKIATMIKGKSPEEIKKILGDDEEDDQSVSSTRLLGGAKPQKATPVNLGPYDANGDDMKEE